MATNALNVLTIFSILETIEKPTVTKPWLLLSVYIHELEISVM